MEKELNLINFLLDLSLKDEKFKLFIQHLNQDSVKKYLVIVSQDSHYSKIRCNNINAGDVDLQIKLTKLYSELNPKQQLELGDILSLTIGSMDERNNNDKLYTFVNILTTHELTMNLLRQ